MSKKMLSYLFALNSGNGIFQKITMYLDEPTLALNNIFIKESNQIALDQTARSSLIKGYFGCCFVGIFCLLRIF